MIDLIYKYFDEAREMDQRISFRRRETVKDILFGIGALVLAVAVIVILMLMAAKVDPFVIRHFTHIGG